ncbi:MAG: hypothetical protein ABEI96_04810 [Haloarculaceae archaeon]
MTQNRPSCGLPRFTDPYLGFSVGRPDGWRVQYSGGVVWLWPRDTASPPTAFVYPGWLDAASANDVAVDFLAGVNSVLERCGDGLLLDGAGNLDGTVGGVTVSGTLWAGSNGQFGLVWGGWAPDDSWSSLKETVMEMGTCYQQGPPTPLEVRHVSGTDATGSVATWEYAIPPGWRDGGATSISLSIVGDEDVEEGLWNALVNFASFVNMQGTHTHEALIDWFVGLVPNWRILGMEPGTTVGRYTDTLGLDWEMKAYPMTSTYGYKEATGVMMVAVTHDSWGPGEYTSVEFWTREVASHRWEQLAAITEIVQWSMRVVSYTVGQNVFPPIAPPISYGDLIWDVYAANAAVHDYTARNFSDALMNNDRVVHPEYPDTQLVVPALPYDPGTCGEGAVPVRDPYSPSGTVRCMPRPTPP